MQECLAITLYRSVCRLKKKAYLNKSKLNVSLTQLFIAARSQKYMRGWHEENVIKGKSGRGKGIVLFFYFLFYFIFKLYIIALVLPNIKMNPPQVYMCSPSWTLLPPPSPYHPSGSSQCTSPKHPVSCIEPGLIWENGIETCILSCMKWVASQEGFESFSPVDLQKSGIIWDVIVMDAIDWTHYAPSSVLTTW